jgi:DamX protein
MDAANSGVTGNPFARDAAVDAACLPPSRAALLDRLLADSRGRGPTSAVIGDPGSGKSAFAGVLAAKIGRERRVAFAAAPSPELAEIVGRLVADRVIIVDDAHRLEPATLEALCGNRTERLILIGREPLLPKLASLSSDVPVRTHRLAALSREEASEYLRLRIEAAGGRADVLFSNAARNRLVERSHGLLSVLESVAAECLGRAEQAGLPQVDVEIVDRAFEKAESAAEPAAEAAEPEPVATRPASDPLPAALPPVRPFPGRPARPLDPGPPERAGHGAWWLAGAGSVILVSFALWKGFSRGEEPVRTAPVAGPSPIHQPVARADTAETAPPPPPATTAEPRATVPSIRESAPREPAPRAVTPPSPALPREPEPPPAKPAPARAPAAREPRWVVQVGVFRSEANAKVAFAELRRHDPGAVMERRKGLHFVVTHAFASRAEAVAFERTLEAAGMSTHVRERHEP